jgi:hypothetical protein
VDKRPKKGVTVPKDGGAPDMFEYYVHYVECALSGCRLRARHCFRRVVTPLCRRRRCCLCVQTTGG